MADEPLPAASPMPLAADALNAGGMRLTVGAADVRTGQMRSASRSKAHIERQLHTLRHVVAELARLLPANVRGRSGCAGHVRVVRTLLGPQEAA